MPILLILLNAVRFIGLEYSPPGFYMDEAAGATQVMCIAQDGYDFYGVHYPLFAAGFPGFGLYTPTYLYGQIAWTSIFGHSIAAFRSFSAFVTVLTVWFLYLFVRNTSNKQTALYVAFAATIMPWAFQFSRIAWDPPVAVMFLIAALWATTWKRYSWIAGLLLALAAYSYPPMRITALVLWVLLPGISIKNKVNTLSIAIVACIPLWLGINDPEFMSRARSLVIWGVFYDNPYEKLGIFALPYIYTKQLLSHFSASFLFFSGDKNLRHSIQAFGMLSWLDLFAIVAGCAVILINFLVSKRLVIATQFTRLLGIAFLGILIGITPAALTNEGLPHALRSLAAWPFFAIVTGVLLSQVGESINAKLVMRCSLAVGILFFSVYQYSYFKNYSKIAKNAFWEGYSPIAKSYFDMSSRGVTCKNTTPILSPVKLKETIYFSNQNNTHGSGHQFLRNHWAEQEEWGVWTYGKGADLMIDLPSAKPSKLTFDVRALVGPNQAMQKVAIWVDGAYLKDVTLSNWGGNRIEIDLPNLSEKQKKVWIEFRVLHPISPIKAGISNTDSRLLGIGLESAVFE